MLGERKDTVNVLFEKDTSTLSG